MNDPTLTSRQREVLAAVLVNYVVTGSPVGSRTVSKTREDHLSPASIRNTMSDLEEMGYLVQPHTSAGRVPTDRGYRFYVDSLMAERPLEGDDFEMMRRAVMAGNPDAGVDELLSRTVKLLAGFSSQVGVVLAPRFSHAVLKRLEFLHLSANRILALFVSQSGMVDHCILDLTEEFTASDLATMTNMVNDNFQGLTLPDIRRRVLQMMQEEKALYDRLLARALDLSRRYLEQRDEGSEELLVDGTSNVVGEPDFADVERMKKLFRAFEDKNRLVELLNACLDQDRSQVLIGSECLDPGFEDLTLITSPYRYREKPVGALGVIGPRRMPYDRLIAMVDSFSRFLTDSLAVRAQGGTVGDAGEHQEKMEDSDE